MSIQIDKNVPMIVKRGPQPRYPWADMDIGDSFLVPDGKLASVRALAYSRSDGRKYSVKQDSSGIRVFRRE